MARERVQRIEPVDERLAVARELVAMAEEAGDSERAAFARTSLAVDLYEAGDLSAARGQLGAVLRDADDLRQPFLSWDALAFAAQVALFEGRLEEAEALARQAYDTGSGCRTVSAEAVFLQQVAAVRRHQGRFGELEQIARGAVTRPAAEGYDCRYNPLLVGLAGLGRAEEARALVDEMFRNGVVETLYPVIVADSDRSTTGRLCCPVGMADVLWALDDVERAGHPPRPLRRGRCPFPDCARASRHDRRLRLGAYGPVDHARMLMRRQGAEDGATAHALLSEARASYQAMTMDFYASRAGELLERLR